MIIKKALGMAIMLFYTLQSSFCLQRGKSVNSFKPFQYQDVRTGAEVAPVLRFFSDRLRDYRSGLASDLMISADGPPK
jgi:hypothetical protein